MFRIHDYIKGKFDHPVNQMRIDIDQASLPK